MENIKNEIALVAHNRRQLEETRAKLEVEIAKLEEKLEAIKAEYAYVIFYHYDV